MYFLSVHKTAFIVRYVLIELDTNTDNTNNISTEYNLLFIKTYAGFYDDQILDHQ